MLPALLVASLLSAGSAAPQVDPKDWQRLAGILQYLESDYPAALESKSPSELAEQVSFADEALATAHALGAKASALLPRLDSVRARVAQGTDPQGVSRDCAALVHDAVSLGGLSRSPQRAPSLARGAELYAQSCAACHGATGAADTEVAKQLQPSPKSFVDAEVMDGLSAYKAFNVATLGVPGTPMPEFSTLSDQDRWALAFYLFTLRQPPCEGKPPPASLEELATRTDAQLAQAYGKEALTCLRRKLPEVDEDRAVLIARNGIDRAMKQAADGDFRGARQGLLDAYLDGIEPVEPRWRARDPELVQAIEEGFLEARLVAERRGPDLEAKGQKLLELVDRAHARSLGPQAFWSVFWLALVILLREGFEASVVIAALLAVLKKMDQREHARVVHAGWMTAIVAGAGAFFFGRHLISGENRELAEGVMALVAVAMLIYAALWLNARSNIRKFMGQIRAAMQGAMSKGSVAGLFAISFTAMLRESFETAVFVQGLALDSPQGALWGALAGVAVLLALVGLISRIGYRLPMKLMFNASTVVLMATAVVLLGKGIHALQEVGLLPLWPMRFFRIDALGLFPDVYSAVPQLLLACAPLVWLAIRQRLSGGGEEIAPEATKHA